MRPGIESLVAASLVIGSVFVTARASATDCSGVASPCIDDDELWPHAGYARFESVGSVQTIAARQLGFALVSAYLNRPVVLRTGQGDQDAVSDQGDATFLWSYGVSRRLELDLALPLTVGQGGTGLAPAGGNTLSDTAARDIRFGFAYALVPHDEATTGAGLATRFEVSAPTGDRSELAGERTGVFAPSLAGEVRWGAVSAGAEIGLRIRPPTEILGARLGTQIVTAAGIGWDVLPHDLLTASIEAWALPTVVAQDTVVVGSGGALVNQPGGHALVPAEWQLALRTAPLAHGDVAFQLGGGGSLPLAGEVSVTSPRFRLVLGIRWAPRTRTP